MFEFLKDKKSYLVAAVFILGGCALAYGIQNGQNGREYEAFVVQKIPLVRSVEATGYLEPATSVDLSFRKSGQVKVLAVDVGQRVKKGDLLASLANSDAKAVLSQSKALLAEAQASLNLELANATDQDIAIARSQVAGAVASKDKVQVDVTNAMTELNNTKKTVEQDIQTAELELENAKLDLLKVQSNSTTTTSQSSSTVNSSILGLKTAIDQLLVSINNVNQVLDRMYGVKELSYQSFRDFLYDGGSYDFSYAKDLYIKNLRNYESLKSQFDMLPASPSVAQLQSIDDPIQSLIRDVNEDVVDSSLLLNKVNQSYSGLSQLKTDLTSASGTFNTNTITYKSAKSTFDLSLISQEGSTATTPLDIQSAQLAVEQKSQNLTKVKVNGETSISSKETQLKALQADLKVAESGVAKANAELEKVLASPRSVDIAPFRARVQQAQAGVERAQSDYNDTLLVAPFDGVITAKNIEVGEQFSMVSGGANKPALSIIDDGLFHIDVNIPETQVTKISGDSAVTVTFDALGPDVFEGRILSVDPAANSIQGIIYYKAKIALVKTDARLKAGMTANVNIDSGQFQDVLAIPEKAIVSDGSNQKTVRTSPDKTAVIRTGVKGNNGLIEVVAGLKEGDAILIPVK